MELPTFAIAAALAIAIGSHKYNVESKMLRRTWGSDSLVCVVKVSLTRIKQPARSPKPI